MSRFSVLVAGGGVAGTEAILRLGRIAGHAVDITLLCPELDLVYRPLAVLEPFGSVPAPRYALAGITADAGARWVRDAVSWVDRVAQTVHTAGGSTLRFDALLLAVGGRELPAPGGMDALTPRTAGAVMRGVVTDIHAGRPTSVAFAIPVGRTWPLPLYELALLTAHHARVRDARVTLTVITPDRRPLQAFGGGAGDRLARALTEAGVMLHTGSRARPTADGSVVLEPSGMELPVDHVITLPAITGPDIRGIPGDGAHRFLITDEYCRVRGAGGAIFAAGDATDLPVKHGSVAAQQADTAAAMIAHLAGVAAKPDPVRPLLRGTLLTGGTPLYMTAHLVAGQGWCAEIYDEPPWPQEEKIAAVELNAYLARRQPNPPST